VGSAFSGTVVIGGDGYGQDWTCVARSDDISHAPDAPTGYMHGVIDNDCTSGVNNAPHGDSDTSDFDCGYYTAFQYLFDPSIWIFAIDDDGYVKMVAISEADRTLSAPTTTCDTSYNDQHYGVTIPFNAATISALWLDYASSSHHQFYTGSTCSATSHYVVDQLTWGPGHRYSAPTMGVCVDPSNNLMNYKATTGFSSQLDCQGLCDAEPACTGYYFSTASLHECRICGPGMAASATAPWVGSAFSGTVVIGGDGYGQDWTCVARSDDISHAPDAPTGYMHGVIDNDCTSGVNNAPHGDSDTSDFDCGYYTAFQYLFDPSIWIFAIDDDGYVKMVAISEADRTLSAPTTTCDTSYNDQHYGVTIPFNAATISALWLDYASSSHHQFYTGSTCSATSHYVVDQLTWGV
jgi:hypothetical protein